MVQTIVTIDGMMCGMCESHINDVVRGHFTVKKVSSSHKKRQTVILSEQPLEQDKLKSVIGETGYTVESVEQKPYEEKKGFAKLFGGK